VHAFAALPKDLDAMEHSKEYALPGLARPTPEKHALFVQLEHSKEMQATSRARHAMRTDAMVLQRLPLVHAMRDIAAMTAA